ncbi:response regulator [bacterium 0.1xD8-71]|nr:response regulator [bacterium 0.1xD8-71]
MMMRESDVIFEPADDRSDRKHVLIIDDDVSVLKTLRYHLQDTYRVSVVNSGKVALDFLLKHKPDLILLDYMMPMYNGAAVLKIIQSREDTKDIPVFFLTGQSDMSTVTECLALNPAGYIVKPISKEALLGKLESVL